MAEVQGRKIINNMQIETSTGTVYWQEDEPVNPKDGDTWFKVVNGKATNSYNRENGVWVEVAFSSQIIAEELIGKIITAAEINGGVINGTTISGAEFINTYENYKVGMNQVADGAMDIENGILQAGASYYLTDDEGNRLYKFANTEAYLQQASLELIQKVYNEAGVQTSQSTSAISGGIISLTLQDSSGSYHGIIDAKAVTSTPWNNLQFGSLYEVKDGNPPQYKVKYNLDGSRSVEFRGAVGLKSGAMTTTGTGTVYRPFSTGNSATTTTIPASIRPSATVQKIGSTNNTSPGQIGARYAVATNGDFPIWVNGTSNYVDISAMSYTID